MLAPSTCENLGALYEDGIEDSVAGWGAPAQPASASAHTRPEIATNARLGLNFIPRPLEASPLRRPSRRAPGYYSVKGGQCQKIGEAGDFYHGAEPEIGRDHRRRRRSDHREAAVHAP